MRIDAELPPDPRAAADAARRLEVAGYDGAWSQEIGHDPFLTLVPAQAATRRIQLGTAIAVAFGRSPLTVAQEANDLQLLSGGRFVLGLGSQVRAHIERRYSMPWSEPARRMEEFVLALRAIWRAWAGEEPLRFEGRFYRHTLMTPFFSPGPNPYGAPKVFLAAVGRHMTEVVGKVADGMLVHGLCTPRYLREVTLPVLEGALARSGRRRADIELAYPAFVATGRDETELDRARRAVAERVAFYASTPAYRPILDHHGIGALQEELNELVRQGRFDELARVLDDTTLRHFAVVAPPERVAPELVARFGALVNRLSLTTPYPIEAEVTDQILAEVKAASPAARSAN